MMSKMNFTYVDEDSINHLLKCNICSKPFIDPVVTRDDDRFCRRCITEKLHSNQSPDFNRQSSFIEDLVPVEGRILFEILDNLLVQCQDCQQTNIRRMHFEHHLLTECPKRIVLCKASDLKCPWSGSSEEIDHHITNCSFELLRPILSETLQCQKQVEQYRLLSNEQHFQIELLKKQIEQYETRTDRLQKGFKAFLELTSQQKVRFENIQKDIEQIRELCHEQTIRQNQIQNRTEQLNQIQSRIEQLNQIDFQQIQEQYTNNQTQLQQLQQQDQYRKNEIIHLRQISDRHHVQIQLLARKKCVIPSVIIPINQRVEELVDTFESNSEIGLDDKQLKDTDIELICKKLIINKQCRKLRLEQNDISAKGVTILSDTLYGNTTLVELYLSNNRISDMGVHALSQALSINNSKLEWLELHSNNITDEGVEYLVEMLKTNKKINLLGLSFNRISDRGVRLLSVAITCYNDTLQSLQLASNKLITDASVDDLKEMITQNQSLQALWINDCSLSTEGKNKLRQAASLNTNFILEV